MKPEAVSNTGPLIALAQADLLDLLPALFESVSVPEAVRDEINAGPPGAIRFNEMSRRCSVLGVEPDAAPDPLLTGILDRGEAAVVLLARSRKADVTLLDERKGRKIAADVFHLNVIGTIGILIRAKRQGLLPEVRTPMDRIRESGYYIHDRIRERALRLAGESD